jgi:hypothetical protein
MMDESATSAREASSNGRVYLDGVVANTRAAAAPKARRGLRRFVLPAILAGAAFIVLRRVRTAVD